jgi:hypothetical protein
MTRDAQLAAWDDEYFDHLDSQIDAYLDRQWEESQAEQRAKRCMTERSGWWCSELKHDGERHVFRNFNPFLGKEGG